MGAVFVLFFIFLILGFCGVVLLASLLIKNKRIKHIVRMIVLLISGMPASWLIFIIFASISQVAYGIYLIIINGLGIFGKIIYKVYLYGSKKETNKKISKTMNICLYLCFLSDPAIIILLIYSIFVSLAK